MLFDEIIIVILSAFLGILALILNIYKIRMKRKKKQLYTIKDLEKLKKILQSEITSLDRKIHDQIKTKNMKPHKEYRKEHGFFISDFFLYFVPGIIALLFAGTFVYLVVQNQENPNYSAPKELGSAMTMIIGYFFGMGVSSVANKGNTLTEEDVKRLVSSESKLESEYNEIKKDRAKLRIIPLREKPTKEEKDRLEDISRRLESIEWLGMPLAAEDYFTRGVDLYYKNNFEFSLKAFDKSIELQPGYMDAWYNKGLSLIKLERFEDALEAYNKAIELKPDDGMVWYNKACVYSLKKDKESTLQCLSRAIELLAKSKKQAKEDEDFKWLWKDEKFKKIII